MSSADTLLLLLLKGLLSGFGANESLSIWMYSTKCGRSLMRMLLLLQGGGGGADVVADIIIINNN